MAGVVLSASPVNRLARAAVAAVALLVAAAPATARDADGEAASRRAPRASVVGHARPAAGDGLPAAPPAAASTSPATSTPPVTSTSPATSTPPTTSTPPASAAPAFAVIVHPDNPSRTMKALELERIYRRRKRFWTDGRAILPVNLPSGDPLRIGFQEKILHDSDQALATFWNREYFQGNAPPLVLRSSRAVRAYVASTPTAVGYVLREDLDDSVVEVEVVHGD